MRQDTGFEQCMKCSICTVYCPMMEVNPAFPGPKQAGPDGERYRLKDPLFFDKALKYCLNCKRCEVACPSGVKIGDIIQTAIVTYGRTAPVLRDRMLANTDLVGRAASALAPVVDTVVSSRPAKALMDCTLGIDHRRTFPAYSSERFDVWFRKHAESGQTRHKDFVTYFHGCYVNYNFPQLGKDLVRILNASGYGVKLLEKEKCCGVPLISNGLHKAAARNAKINLASIRLSGTTVLTTSSSCTLAIRDSYPEVLGIDNSDIRETVTLATRFLYENVESGRVKLSFKDDYHARIAYHTPCHLQKLGWNIYSVRMLEMIPGVELVRLDQQCCGIAGTFGFKKENYEHSQKIGEKLFSLIRDAAPDFVATDCETCKWQIEMSAGVKVLNPISVIAEALDIEKTTILNNNDNQLTDLK